MKLRDGTPGEVGISPSHVDRIRERCEGWVRDGIHPALVVLAARKGVIFLHESFGMLSPEEDSPQLPLDAVFPIASVSKPITALCAMILVEQGLLGLNRPVQEYIPEFIGEGKELVKVHHLLTHTTGLNDDEIVWQAIEKKEAQSEDLPDMPDKQHPTIYRWLHYGFDTPLTNDPGEVMIYSGYGFYLLGEIIRRLSGQSLGEFAKDQLFDRLGMVDTSYAISEPTRTRLCIRPEDSPDSYFNETEQQERPSPSSGVYSTAMDMAIFGQMFLNQGKYGGERILSPVTVRAMTRNQLPGVPAKYFDETFPEAGWGLSWSVNASYKGEVYGEQLLSPSYYVHGGAGGVVLWIDPVQEIVGVFFSVLTKTLDDRPLLGADLFMNMIAAAIEE